MCTDVGLTQGYGNRRINIHGQIVQVLNRKHAHRKNLEAFQYAEAFEFASASFSGGGINGQGLF